MTESNNLIMLKDVPDLETMVPTSIDLSYEYWTPEKEGEIRRLIFMSIEQRSVPDQNDDTKSVMLDCAVFVEPSKDGAHKAVVNGSKRLVAVFVNNSIDAGTPVEITYRGKKKNLSNSNMSDAWSVQVLGEAS